MVHVESNDRPNNAAPSQVAVMFALVAVVATGSHVN